MPMKPSKTMRERGLLGGRPALDDKCSVGFYDSPMRTFLIVRIGAGVAKRVGWKAGTKVVARMPDRRVLNLSEDADEGLPLLLKSPGSKTLTLQQTAGPLLQPMRATVISPLVIGRQISLPIKR